MSIIHNDPSVIELDSAEAQRILASLGEGGPGDGGLLGGFKMVGAIDATCRNVEDGSIAWHVEKKNLVTDHGRRRLMDAGITQMYVVVGPGTETPMIERYYYGDGPSGINSGSGAITPSYDAATMTRTWSTNFGVPSITRQVSLIGLCGISEGGALNGMGLFNLCAYTLLSQPKTQTTSQTLEVAYKITLTPVLG